MNEQLLAVLDKMIADRADMRIGVLKKVLEVATTTGSMAINHDDPVTYLSSKELGVEVNEQTQALNFKEGKIEVIERKAKPSKIKTASPFFDATPGKRW